MVKDVTLKTFILAFIGVVLAVAFISSLATQTNTVTAKTEVDDEVHNLASCVALTSGGGWEVNESDTDCNVTVTNPPTGWQVEDCPLTVVVVENGTGTALTADTDFVVFDTTGIIKLEDTTSTENLTGNNTYVDYKYCGAGYVNSSWGRDILGVNVGLYAIAILILVIAAVFVYLKNKED